jgi:type IV secretory pathway VirB10-like protein
MEEHTRNEHDLAEHGLADDALPARGHITAEQDEPLVDTGPLDELRADDLRRPDPPPATRLNRLAVVVAAGIMSATLLVVAFTVGGERDEVAEAREQQVEAQGIRRATSGRTFYDRPLGSDTLAPRVDPITGLSDDELTASAYSASDYDEASYDAGTVVGNARDGFSQPSGMVPPPYGGAGADSPYGSSGAYHSASYGSEARQPSEEEEALARAKRSALMPQGLSGSGATAGRSDFAAGGGVTREPGGASESLNSSYLETLTALENVMGGRARGGSPGVAQNVPGGATPAAWQTMAPAQANATMHPGARTEQFVWGAVAAREAEGRYIATAVERPISPYEVREGTLVEAYLITGVHSDLPGEVIAQVSRNVYDSETQQVLLVPRGTRLIGTYDNQVAVDQSRLLVAWTRMVFPDGRSVALPGLGSKDGTGASGLTGRVNRHYWQAFGNAAMLALVGGSLTYAASRSRPAGGTFAYPTPGEVMAGSVATELSRVATEMLRGNVNRRPTIQIPAGTRFNVFMNGDLALAPYAPEDGFMDVRRQTTSQRMSLPVAGRY